MSDRPNPDQLGFTTRLAYGIGDFGPAMAGNVLNVFFFFFLTTCAGVAPDRAGLILLLSNGWSAISTLGVGLLCDRTESRWGRRRIWMLVSAPILATSFWLHWWLPPLSDWAQFGYYTAIALLFQTAGNAFSIPYGALVTDLSADPDEHIRLNGMRFGFSLSGCIGSLLIAQVLSRWTYLPQQQLFDLGGISALAVIGSIGCCCWGTSERSPGSAPRVDAASNWKTLLQNRPLLLLMGIYSLSWLATQMTPAILPYFVVNYLGWETPAITAIVLVMQSVALGAMFLWEPLSRRIGKPLVYWTGASLWAIAELGLFHLQASQLLWIYGAIVVMGAGMAVAYLIPSAMLPEVINFDQQTTGLRRDGLIYSILVLMQKATLAIGFFLVGQLLAWSGFQEKIPGPVQILQPDSARAAIRLIVVSLPILALLGGLILVCAYSFVYEPSKAAGRSSIASDRPV